MLIDLDNPAMHPLHDPLRSLVYVAADREVQDVHVDGVQVVADGTALTLDFEDAAGRLGEAQQRALQSVPRHDLRRRLGRADVPAQAD